MIELGGNIKLDGFEGLENHLLIVVKKVIGNYAKKISDKNSEFKELTVVLKKENSDFKIEAKTVVGDKTESSDAVSNNLFVALGDALSKLLEKI